MAGRAYRTALSLLLTAALLAVFLWNVDFSEVVAVLRQADPVLIAASVALALLAYWLRAVRWHLLLRPVGRVRHSSALLATAVGYAAMSLLPARMGDIVRPVVLARRESKPTSGALASIVTERLFDIWTVLFFFLVFVAWPPPMGELSEQARTNLHTLGLTGYAIAAVLVVGTLFLLALFRYQTVFVDTVTAPIARLRPRWQAAAARFLEHFLDGLRVIQRPGDLLATSAASIILWMVIFCQVKVILLAFSIDLPLRVAYFLVTLSVIGLAIPTPAGVGGFHKATQIGLTAFFAIDLNLATGVAIAHHAICFLPITAIGLLCLPALGGSLPRADAAAPEGRPGGSP